VKAWGNYRFILKEQSFMVHISSQQRSERTVYVGVFELLRAEMVIPLCACASFIVPARAFTRSDEVGEVWHARLETFSPKWLERSQM